MHCGHDYSNWLSMVGVVMWRFDLVIHTGMVDGVRFLPLACRSLAFLVVNVVNVGIGGHGRARGRVMVLMAWLMGRAVIRLLRQWLRVGDLIVHVNAW
jgi:small-conductance mechanosensitive channel